MKKRKKINKIKVSIFIILIIFTLTITVFGRYIYNNIREAYLASQQFYFSSNILTVDGSKYQYDNWGGKTVYPIKVDLYSYESSVSKLDYDLNYTVSCSTSDTDKIKLGINSDEENAPTTATGKILKDTHTSTITIYVTPIAKLNIGDKVKINIAASTSKPYQKIISTEITLTAATQGKNTYSIEDIANRDYAVLKLTCPGPGTEITLNFDPTQLRIDSNDEIYINRDKSEGATETTTVEDEIGNQYTYVKKIVYEMPAETTKYVKFYKADKTKNYTYPGGSETTSPIKVTM